jgi:hypothetical protein
VLELQELLQLHEQQVVSALQTQRLESMAELEPLPPVDLRLLRTSPNSELVQMLLVVKRQVLQEQLAQLARLLQA